MVKNLIVDLIHLVLPGEITDEMLFNKLKITFKKR